MLKEFVDAIAARSIDAAGPQFKSIDPTKPAVCIEDGKVKLMPLIAPWRQHVARDLETICAFSEAYDNPVIWYDRSAIVLVVDDVMRRDFVTLPMIHSEQIQKLVALNDDQPLIDQRSLIFMLRTIFTPASLGKFPKLIDSLRQAKFESGNLTDANLQRGNASIGKSIKAAASFLEALPEFVTMSIPVFENSFARKAIDVQCVLEIHEAEEKFQFFPLPGEVERAYAEAEANLSRSIRDLLDAKKRTPVYYGIPK